VKEGDKVEQFQNLADVSTDKLFTQIPATEDGKIHKLYIQEGQPCQVGAILLEIEVEDGGASASTSKPSSGSQKSETPSKAEVNTIGTPTKDHPAPVTKEDKLTEGSTAKSSSRKETSERSQASPAVREYARSKGVSIHEIIVSNTLYAGNWSRGQSHQRGH